MVVTEYNGYFDKHGKVKNYTWERFCSKLSHPVVSIGMSLESFKALQDDYTRDKDGKILDYKEECQPYYKTRAGGAIYGEVVGDKSRVKENITTRTAVYLDYEKVKSEIYDRIESGLQGITYCYHTTCKHCPPDDIRLHIIIPFTDSVDWQYCTIVAWVLANRIGLDGFDDSSLRRSQMALYCVGLRGSEYRFHKSDGEVLDVNKFLTDTFGTLDIDDLVKLSGVNTSGLKHKEVVDKVITLHNNQKVRIYSEFKPDKPRRGDVISCFNATYSVRDILDSLPEYEAVGDRYKYYKAKGVANVQVTLDDKRCYSHHSKSGDPLFDGHSHSAFDLWVMYNTSDSDNFSQKVTKAHNFAMNNDKYVKYFLGR